MSAAVPPPPRTRNRAEIPDTHKWNLADIYADWASWERDFAALQGRIEEYAALKGDISHRPLSMK